MKIILPGGSGQVGTLLARQFQQDGHDVVTLSRRPAATPWPTLVWDGATLGPWAAAFDDADVVINLAGCSVNCRYNAANRQAILDSRLDSTRVIAAAIRQARRPPPLWLQSSTATIYAHRFDAPNDEATGLIGGSNPDAPDTWRFSIEVARAWEAEAIAGVTAATRLVILRSAMIMSPDRGGIFDTILRLVRLGLGGSVAGGRQYVSWIHDVDFGRAVAWLIAHKEVDGIVNLAAPNPLPYRDFIGALRAAWGIRLGLPATAWMAAIGAFLMGTETELILKSRRVVPGRLTAAGFTFNYPDWPPAAADLVRRWRAAA